MAGEDTSKVKRFGIVVFEVELKGTLLLWFIRFPSTEREDSITFRS